MKIRNALGLAIPFMLLFGAAASAQDSDFVFQGKLTVDGDAAEFYGIEVTCSLRNYEQSLLERRKVQIYEQGQAVLPVGSDGYITYEVTVPSPEAAALLGRDIDVEWSCYAQQDLGNGVKQLRSFQTGRAIAPAYRGTRVGGNGVIVAPGQVVGTVSFPAAQ